MLKNQIYISYVLFNYIKILGDRVYSEYNFTGDWFYGQITDINNGSYTILYDDDDRESGIDRDRIQFISRPEKAILLDTSQMNVSEGNGFVDVDLTKVEDVEVKSMWEKGC